MIKYPLYLLYRIWYYVLVFVPIVVFFPVILATILSEKTYPLFFKIARIWAKIILTGMGFNYKISGAAIFEEGKSYVLVANHTSMTDIMLMLVLVKNHPFVFVGKKELAQIPIFGFIYKRVCILVDRNSSKSRFQVFALRSNTNYRLCLWYFTIIRNDFPILFLVEVLGKCGQKFCPLFLLKEKPLGIKTT
jgi:1-acyl-sn-glycerol-3-phosphate acyltransferase